MDSQGDYTEAGLLFKRSLGILENFMGQEHPSLAIIIGHLADIASHHVR